MLRFKKLIKRFGFKIVPVFQRPDMLSVRYHHHHLFTIPSKIYDHPVEEYRFRDMVLPHYFELEMKARYWNWVVKGTPYLKEKEKLEREQKDE